MSPQDPSPGPPQKLFALHEANALLPCISETVVRLQEIFSQFKQVAEGKDYPASLQRSNGHPMAKPAESLPSLDAIQSLRAEAESLIEDIVGLGVALKDIEQGLVDFPAERDGRVVYLCWKQGEDEIRFWHELDTGFAGRQPL
jgi:hypothetical protein